MISGILLYSKWRSTASQGALISCARKCAHELRSTSRTRGGLSGARSSRRPEPASCNGSPARQWAMQHGLRAYIIEGLGPWSSPCRRKNGAETRTGRSYRSALRCSDQCRRGDRQLRSFCSAIAKSGTDASFALQPAARRDQVQIAVDDQLEQSSKMIAGPAGSSVRGASEPQVYRLKFRGKETEHPDS